ncbi:MAG TPA: zinc ribbon domain-containing protein, partial [Polyangiaceae bacterium]
MTYEYICTACGHGWEAEQAISASPLKTCPKCGTDHAKRQISGGAGFLLKGGGWYADGDGSSKGG